MKNVAKAWLWQHSETYQANGQLLDMQRIHSLDGLWAISIALVIRGHALHLPGIIANTGVRIFFVISGYLITTLLLKEPQIDLRGFYIRRFWRIFPPLYALLAFVMIFGCGINLHDFLHAFTFTVDYDLQGASRILGHLWSLSVEEQFYLLWPPVLAWLSYKRRVAVVTAIISAVPLIRLAEHFFGFRTAGIN